MLRKPVTDEPIKCFMVYSSYCDTKPKDMRVSFTDMVITEKGRNPRRFIIGKNEHVLKSRGQLSKWIAFLDVEGRCTIDIKTGKPLNAKDKLKIDALTFKAFWEARTAMKRDYLLVGLGVASGSFIPFLLKWVASMFGRVTPW